MLKIYNPRHFLRHGASQPMQDATDGHVVLLRVGEVAPEGKPVLINPKSGNAGPQFDGVRDKVFKLVEVPPAELERLEATLRRQSGQEKRPGRTALNKAKGRG